MVWQSKPPWIFNPGFDHGEKQKKKSFLKIFKVTVALCLENSGKKQVMGEEKEVEKEGIVYYIPTDRPDFRIATDRKVKN